MEQKELQKNADAAEKLTAPQDLPFEESEESSDNDAENAPWLQSDEVHTPSPSDICTGTILEELAPAVSKDRYDTAHGPAASQEHCQAAQGPTASEDRHNAACGTATSQEHFQVAQEPTASQDHRNAANWEYCQVMRDPVASKQHCRTVQGLREEDEESTGSEGEDSGTTY